MKERHILMSTPMVQAILDGRKTMTRRTIKPQPDDRGLRTTNVLYEDWHGREIKCKYGEPGDLLYVKETYARLLPVWYPDQFTLKASAPESEKITCQTENDVYYYKAGFMDQFDHTWKPSLFMPKAAARIWLQVTDVLVERLQDVWEEDAMAEGIIDTGFCYLAFMKEKGNIDYPTAKEAFKALWESINGPESWDLNSWVWVIGFRVLSTTGRKAAYEALELAS